MKGEFSLYCAKMVFAYLLLVRTGFSFLDDSTCSNVKKLFRFNKQIECFEYGSDTVARHREGLGLEFVFFKFATVLTYVGNGSYYLKFIFPT